MLAKVRSVTIVGLDAVPIEVEVDVAAMGLPSFTIVGLPDKSVEEAKERVRSSLKNSGFEFPAKRITVNLAPADIPKEGPSFDLPIAIGLLVASSQLEVNLERSVFMGELSLDGSLRQVKGVLSAILYCKNHQVESLFIPYENGSETKFDFGVQIVRPKNLLALYNHFNVAPIEPEKVETTTLSSPETDYDYDFKYIKGQEFAKRALMVAAAGGHNILLSGPPGTGKTMLAKAFSSILPPLTFEESVEVAKIYSVIGHQSGQLPSSRPFRSPHHTISSIGLIGGGSYPRPGEITLAHRGVLFLDELPEFPRQALEALRQPLEDGQVAITRAAQAVTYPARFNLIATANPCACGYYGSTGTTKNCICSPIQVERYNKKLSGPILDRIDMHIQVPQVEIAKLTDQDTYAESSASIRAKVISAREIQKTRFPKIEITNNSEMTNNEIKKYCQLSEDSLNLIRQALVRFNLSARSFGRIIKVARTIADLESRSNIEVNHVAEALQYRVNQA